MSANTVYLENLRDELKVPITNSRQGWRILERMATCFVAVSQDVHTLGNEVYGNGMPGGLKLQVALMEQKIDTLQNMLGDIQASLDVSYGRRKGDLPFGGSQTSFDKFTHWLADKIVPSLVVGLLTFVVNILLFGFAFTLALTNGWLSLP